MIDGLLHEFVGRCGDAGLRLALGAGKRPPTPAAAFEGYGKVVVAVDDLAYEGVLDVTGREGAARAARLRGEA